MADSEQLLQPCPHCATLIDVSDEEPFAQVHCPICGGAMRVRRQFNNYQLEETLGAGGMGAVYRAVDLNLARPVALKLLRKEFSADEEYIAKFENEARITASINHPHVVKVFSYGSDHGVFYIAMELVDKGSLDDLINLQKRVAEAQVLEVGVQAAQGLQAASNKGLIHRDVKPGNILFADAHTAKIVDFGLALLMEQEAEARGEVWGTPYYVAPEKLNKEPEDFRSDIYSLGGTLFHALAGRPPFEAETASLVALKHIKSQAVSLQAFAPHVSSATAYVINRMLNKDPAQRYQSYDELIEHLNYARTELLDKAGTPAAKKATVVVGGKQEKVMAFIMLGVLVLLLASGALAWVFRDSLFHRDEDRPRQASAAAKGNEDIRRQYDEAKSLLLDGKYADALPGFEEVTANEAADPLLRMWAQFHTGLALLLDGQLTEAQQSFSQLRTKAKDGTDEPSDLETVQFFQNATAVLAGGKAVPAAVLRSYSANTIEGLAVLAYGLVDWHMGEFDGALQSMRAFDQAKFADENKWVADYRKLSGPYLADLEAYARIEAQRKAAKTPEQKKAVVAASKAARESLQVGGKLADALKKIEVEIERSLTEQREAEDKDQAALAANEALQMERFEQEFSGLVREYRRDEAAKRLAALSVRTESARERKANLAKKLAWLRTFDTQLRQDIRGGTYTDSVRRKDGALLPGRVVSVDAAGLVLRSDYGNMNVPWSEIAPEEVMKMATFFAQADPANAPSRYGLLGVYAVTADHTREGHRLILEAARKEPRYTDELTTFFESADPVK